MEDLLRFVELTQEFKAIRRAVILAKEGRQENDAEHSWQLALISWYLIHTQHLKLDVNLCLRYALVHDLPEVFAGDTPAIGKKYSHARATKHDREQQAIQKLLYEYPEFHEIHDLIRAYELKQDEESKFVYALDKIIPIMNIYLDKGHSWKVQGITLDDLIEAKTGKTDVSPEVKKYFDLMVELLHSNQATLFPTSN